MRLSTAFSLQLLSAPSSSVDLFLCRLLEFYCSIFCLLFLGMRLFRELSSLYGVDAKKVTWDVIQYTDIWSMLHLFEVHEALGLDEVQVFFGVLRLVIVCLEVKCVFRAVILVVIVHRQVVVQVAAVNRDTSLKSPASCHILDCVSTSSKEHCRYVPALDKPNTISMAFNRCIVSPQFITSQRISTTLKNNSVRSIVFLYFCHNRPENLCELLIIYEWL